MTPRLLLVLLACGLSTDLWGAPPRPNIILVMADDQGWGQVGYNGHPVLKTPHLDAMAANGLRFNRFYAAGPVCSPTRASVLTGRTHTRTGVPSHGHNLCLQEKTLPRALQQAGYATAHFGKWHLNGVRGPGVPVLGDDANHPGRYGFDTWLSVTNFFDLDPLMSRQGTFEQHHGDSSNVIVHEAISYISQQTSEDRPFLAVIWYGSPHSPQRSLAEDRAGLGDTQLAHHLGEIAGIDRSIGVLRKGLRDLGIEDNTLVWYCSDNGGLTLDPDAVGTLRGHKGELFEGGIRVPGVVEWPGHITPSVTDFPASTMDIFPTLLDLLDLPEEEMLAVHDGESIAPLLAGKTPSRTHGIPFLFQTQAALIEGDYKLISRGRQPAQWQLFNLQSDPSETNDLASEETDLFRRLRTEAEAMLQSVEASAEGDDYPEGRVLQPPRDDFWREMPEYRPYLNVITNALPDSGRPARRRRQDASR
jgi:arylsulfatase A-like enzyme